MNKAFLEGLQSLTKKYGEKLNFSYSEWETDFLRFYRSKTNYNISNRINTLGCTVHRGKRAMSFSIDEPDIAGVEKKLQAVLAVIDGIPEDPDFVDIENDTRAALAAETVNNITAVGLEKKIGLLNEIKRDAATKGFRIFGTFITNYVEHAVINSSGVFKTSVTSPFLLDVKAVKDDNDVTVIENTGGSDYGAFSEKDFRASLSAKMDNAGKELIDMEPGRYEVVLSPSATAEFMGYLLALANGGTLDSNNSFFEGKVGQKLFPETLTVTDDPLNPRLVRTPYNDEGRLLGKLPVIERGVFRNFFIDNYYGNKLKMDKNGNSGSNIVIGKGKIPLSDMIKGIKKGLFISNLHYMNFINPKETSVTGLTRDGTFLIENGEIKNVVNNLRFTVKIEEVFRNAVEFEDREHVLARSGNYGEFGINTALAPHIKVKDFNITSSTKTV